jgi:ubiquinone/menaquinone biosynthesis C-methylase UbiE
MQQKALCATTIGSSPEEINHPHYDKVWKLLHFNRSLEWRNCTQLLLAMHGDSYWSSAGAVLDVGCGIGTFCNAVAASFPTERVLGVEHDAGVVATARRHARPRVEIRQGKGNPNLLDFPNQMFDWVTCMHTLQKSDNPGLLVSEMVRVLRPNGIATFVVPNVYYDLLELPWDLLARIRRDPGVKHYWSRGMFQRMLHREAGLDSIAYPFGRGNSVFPAVKSWVIVNAWKEGCYDTVCSTGDWTRRGTRSVGGFTLPHSGR